MEKLKLEELRVTSSNPRVTYSNLQVTSSNLRVTSSNPRVRKLKARIERLKTRVARLKPRVRRFKVRVEAIKKRKKIRVQNNKFYKRVTKDFNFFHVMNLSLMRSNLEVSTFPPQHGIEKSLWDHYIKVLIKLRRNCLIL